LADHHCIGNAAARMQSRVVLEETAAVVVQAVAT
jgi:cytochrome P450